MAGLDQQVEVLVRMLGITCPDLKARATRLLLDSLSQDDSSPITDCSFLGRIKKLLFKPQPKKPKNRLSSKGLDPPHQAPKPALTSPVTPIARGKVNATHWLLAPYGDEVYPDDYDPSTDQSEYNDDPIEVLSYGSYNSKGQRYDEDGEIVRDERVYICEEAIYSFAGGTPHITDTYDLYALVRALPLEECRRAADIILSTGSYEPGLTITDLHQKPEIPPSLPSSPAQDLNVIVTVSEDPVKLDVDLDYSPVHAVTAPVDDSPPTRLTTKQRQKRNLVSHFISTIQLRPCPDLVGLTNRQRKKLVHQRRCAEKARIRQLRIFLKAIDV